MTLKNTVKEIQMEFKEYLAMINSSWASSTVDTICSDAFYAYNNNIVIPFWNCLMDDNSMQQAKIEIENFLINVVKSNNAKQRASEYFSKLNYLKKFFDEKYGGVENRIGSEMYAEKNIYDIIKLNYEKKIDDDDTIKRLVSEVGIFNETSYKLSIAFFKSLMEGKIYKYTANAEITKYFINRIGIDYGSDYLKNALFATREHIKYYYETTNNKSNLKRRICGEIAKKNNIDVSFDDEIFNKILSKTSNKKSQADFLKWFSPVIEALKKIGASGTPKEVREQIIKDLNLTDDIIKATRGKNKTNKFNNEIAWARNYLTYEGYVDKSIRGMWTLTEKGKSAIITDEIASNIFKKWVNILKSRRDEASSSVDEKSTEMNYWLYAPGENSYKWDEFYKEGIMGLGWDELGDFTQYPTKESMKLEMKELYGKESTYKMAALATWQFANDIKEGDIIFAKKGLHTIVGRGIVKSDYIFDDTRKEYKHIRKVEWMNHGEWEHPGQAAMKTLTDITSYMDYVQKLESLFINDTTIEDKEVIVYPTYTEDDFLDEVFMSAKQYNTIKNLLLNKKNIILQGAPGVGKTFAAKRLAYSIMGEKDTSRVMMIQFHQSYSYEDFIMGYRPSKDGFELTPGPFYKFCKNAEEDDERDYFFIIDEINRGNLSKIFGELLMLIENDKRGEKLKLLYANEMFSVPENIHIMGMMNTADRSLAMIDYALRRRFAFYELEPAFNSEGFNSMLGQADNIKLNNLIEKVKNLNETIAKDESLGKGFRIGHSYFCTNELVADDYIASIIEFELIPLLNEYWFDEQSKIEEWTKKLRGVLSD